MFAILEWHCSRITIIGTVKICSVATEQNALLRIDRVSFDIILVKQSPRHLRLGELLDRTVGFFMLSNVSVAIESFGYCDIQRYIYQLCLEVSENTSSSISSPAVSS